MSKGVMWAMADPLAVALLLTGAGALAVLAGRRAGIALVLIASLLLYVFSTPYASQWLLWTSQQDTANTGAAGEEPGAIVVLSADVRADPSEPSRPTAGQVTLDRLRAAARLARETHRPIFVTGDWRSAAAMRDGLVDDFRIPVRWVEENSHSTFDNARHSAEILRSEGIRTVYLVTDGGHMPRAAEAFMRQGVQVLPVPATVTVKPTVPDFGDLIPCSCALHGSYDALHELAARVWYSLGD